MSDGNREFKSDVFSMLMEDRSNALQVYNALNNSSINDPNLVDVRTLEKGISLSVRNDAAFIVDSAISVYEHQSTVCPNMPMRSLIYFTTIIEIYIKDKNIYGSTLITIPEPQFVVFYNGDREQPEEYEMKLSDAFQKHTVEPKIELTCKVYNINKGQNASLLNNCLVLKDYSTFVSYVRFYHEDQDKEDLARAINRAIDRCIKENVLAEFLQEHRDEVVKVTTLDYTYERQIELERASAIQEGFEEGVEKGIEKGLQEGIEKGLQEGREKGLQEGREEGRIYQLLDLVKEGLLSIDVAIQKSGLSKEEFMKLL